MEIELCQVGWWSLVWLFFGVLSVLITAASISENWTHFKVSIESMKKHKMETLFIILCGPLLLLASLQYYSSTKGKQ